MEENKRGVDKIAIIFNILVMLVIVAFVIGEKILPREDNTLDISVKQYEGEWYRVHENGTRELMEVPCNIDMNPGNELIYETTLPNDLADDTCFMIRSSQTNIRVFLDGELIQVYDTSESRPFGSNTVSAYVFFTLNASDSGKTLRFVQVSYGYMSMSYKVNNPIYGSGKDVLIYAVSEDGFSLILSGVLFILGVATIIVCLVISISFKRKFALFYLGWCITWTAIWVICESKLRQFLVPNGTVIADVAFYAIIIIPFAALLYMDNIQEFRFHKLYRVLEISFVVDAVLCTLLQVTEVLNLIQTMYVTHVIILASCVVAFYCIVKDIKDGYIKNYKQVAVGLVGFAISGIIEICIIYTKKYTTVGVFMTAGLIFLLIFSAIKMGRDIIKIESERQKALILSESKGKFLANMSHEIRTPINSIIGMNEMVLRECNDSKILEYSKQIEDSSKLLLGLVNDVLDYSKIESGKLSILPREYETDTMIKDVLEMIKERALEKKLEIEFDIDEKLPAKLLGDDIRIRQILVNLLSNAVKYTEKGYIKLIVKADQDLENKIILQMCVEDSGQGIRQENLDKLFDSFTRMEESKNRSIEGTGLGLSITKNLVDLMNGQIHVTSEFGKGSAFTVFIPQEVVDITAIGKFTLERKDVVVGKKGPGMFTASKAKILVVDDNAMNRVVMKALLKRTKVQLTLAESGSECLRLCMYNQYDLIFMDHLMPEMDGIETLEQLKQQKGGKNESTKVVALTANVIEGAKQTYLDAGFVAYLSKPVEVEKLENMMYELLPENMVELTN